jgi:2-polyprenyl-3-methyl-5-hydroxy-6-metoxy-1,4-benzoquinol methylase
MYLAKLLKHFKQYQNIETILDAGCGGGDFAEGLSANGYRVYGLDLNESGIGAAQRRNIGTFALSSVYDDLLAPFGLQQVDAVISVEVIEHLYSPRIFLSRAKDALRTGGLLAITTPYWGYLKNIALAVTNRIDKQLTVLWDGGHIKHFSRATLTRMVMEQGFDFVAFEGCGDGIRAVTPFLWNEMLMIFRKP